jgi:hypothetical protein
MTTATTTRSTRATKSEVESAAHAIGWELTEVADMGDGYVWRLECADGDCTMWEGDREVPAWNEFTNLDDAAGELADMLAGVP